MKERDTTVLNTLRWESVQLLFCVIFLLLSYLQETALARFIGKNHPKMDEIHLLLNTMMFPLLPDYFYFLFFQLMLLSISFIIFKSWRWFFISIIGTLCSVLFVADKIYFSFFSSLITNESFAAASQVWDVKSAVFSSIMPLDLFFIVSFSSFIFVGIFLNKKLDLNLARNKFAFTIDKLIGILAFFLAIHAYNVAFYFSKTYVTVGLDHVIRVEENILAYKDLRLRIPNYQITNRYFADAFGIMNFHIKNLKDAFNDRYLNNTSDASAPPPKGIYEFFEKKQEINKISSPFHGIAKGRNVFLIHFESLHPILIGTAINGTPITPTLNQLEKNSFYWRYILDQVTMGGSSDAEFESLTGMIPGTESISAFNTSCMPKLPSLPRQLKALGYQTISLHGYKSSFWNRNITQPLLGFENLYFENSYKYKMKIGLGISDKEFFSQSVNLLKNHQPPFFAFLMTLTSHFPYSDLPEDYLDFFSESLDLENPLMHYFQAIRYTDDALGDFFLKIKDSGLWENSIFIIYGDHQPGGSQWMNDELIKATGKSFHNPRYACVPIIIVIPGHENFITTNKEKFSNIVGGLYDIFPTVMHLLGEDPSFGVFGSHLFVDNSQRDPVPVFRFKDGFVFNGIQYRQQGKVMNKDEIGIVFSNDPKAIIVNDNHRLIKYKQSLLPSIYCNYIYKYSVDISSFKENEN